MCKGTQKKIRITKLSFASVRFKLKLKEVIKALRQRETETDKTQFEEH